MPATLVSAPDDDPRPKISDPAIFTQAVAPILERMRAWAVAYRMVLADEEITFAAAAAMIHGKLDGFRATYHLHHHFKWPCDMSVARLMAEACLNVPNRHKIATMEWALRTKIRFPAKDNDIIGWRRGVVTFTGSVIAVDRQRASALVTPTGISIQNSVNVNAEDVYLNVQEGVDASNPTYRVDPALMARLTAPAQLTGPHFDYWDPNFI